MALGKVVVGMLGVFLLSAPPLCCSQDIASFGGRSATDVFHDRGVVSLVDAVHGKHIDKAKALIAAGVSVNASGDAGMTPLIWMLVGHDYKAMQMLLDLGANPNQAWQVGAPVYLAASSGDKQALNLLLDYHGDPNSPIHQQSAMMQAMTQDHFDCAEILLRRGANINYHESVVSTIFAPLSKGRFDWIVWLLDNGYNYDLMSARRGVARRPAVPEQAPWQTKALQIIDRRIADQPIVSTEMEDNWLRLIRQDLIRQEFEPSCKAERPRVTNANFGDGGLIIQGWKMQTCHGPRQYNVFYYPPSAFPKRASPYEAQQSKGSFPSAEDVGVASH